MAIDKLLGVELHGGKEQNLVLALIVSVLLLLSISLFLVWLNTERTKLNYEVRQLQLEVDARVELNAKLGVERDHLLSPYILGQKAASMKLYTAKPGQIRRLEGNTSATEKNKVMKYGLT